MDKPKYEMGNRIKKFRRELGMSQKQLANLIGVSNSRVSNWEQGINRPDVDILPMLCSVLKQTPSSLLGMRIGKEELTEKEQKVIYAYRLKKEMRESVDKLLEIEDK